MVAEPVRLVGELLVAPENRPRQAYCEGGYWSRAWQRILRAAPCFWIRRGRYHSLCSPPWANSRIRLTELSDGVSRTRPWALPPSTHGVRHCGASDQRVRFGTLPLVDL